MATRLENRIGIATNVGPSYVLVATATELTNSLIHVANVTSEESTGAVSNLRLYIADASWTTGRPTGGTLVARLAADTPQGIGDVFQFSGNLIEAGEKVVAWASVATSLDVIVNSVEIT